jgi:hypothetical protein
MRANCSKLEGVFDLLPDEQERIAVVLDEAYDSTKPLATAPDDREDRLHASPPESVTVRAIQATPPLER